jgi:DNA-binding response OmpR family regulator
MSRESGAIVTRGVVASLRRGIVVQSTDLVGWVVLVVEDEPLIALDLQTVLQDAGAKVMCANTRDAAQAAASSDISAAVLDARPGSSEHRSIARHLKRRGVPFLFYATHEPEDVTTVRGAPLVRKPERPERIVAAVRVLLAGSRS